MKTFVIFATFLSLAFASQELLQCMDERAINAGNDKKWEEEHQAGIKSCEDTQNVAANLGKDEKNACDPDEQKNLAAHSHQHEACIFSAFGWVNETGGLDLEKMFKDFNADEDFMNNQMKNPETGYLKCMKDMAAQETEAVKDALDSYKEKCPPKENPSGGDAEEQKKAQEKKMKESLKYGAEGKCAFIEMSKECEKIGFKITKEN